MDVVYCRVLISVLLNSVSKTPVSSQIEQIKLILEEGIVTLDSSVACIEGLGVLAACDPLIQPLVIEYLRQFLLTPSFIFLELDEVECSILQECTAHIMATILESYTVYQSGQNEFDAGSIKKTTLFAFINSMHSSFKSIGGVGGVNGDHSRDGQDDVLEKVEHEHLVSRRLANCGITISHLTRVLKPKDVHFVIFSCD